MALTLAGAIADLIDTLELDLAVYADEAPEDREFPYVVIRTGLAVVPDAGGDVGDPDSTGHTAADLVAADLYQQYRHPDTGAVTEDPALPSQLAALLRHTTVAGAPQRVYGLRLLNMPRVPDPDSNIVHHAATLQARRVL